MWGSSSWKRSAETTIPCKECKKPLTVKRSCHHVYMECSHCKKKSDISLYLQEMDDALEAFMEGVYCDRI